MLPVYLITGSMAAGKSSVAQALAGRFPRSVHIRGDTFRRMVVSGRAEMTPDEDAGAGSQEAWSQLRLRYRLAAQTALTYRESGLVPVVRSVILGPILREVTALYAGVPLRLVVLCPPAEVVEGREQGRAKRAYGVYTPAELDRALREDTPHLGFWLDSAGLSVEATVDRILGYPDWLL